MQTSRRTLLSAGVLTGTALTATAGPVSAATTRLDLRPTAATPRLRTNPFTLGIASGDPAPDGFVIWTRLAPSPLDDDGLGGMPSRRYEVRWEVARDPRFRRVERRGTVTAGPETAHAVHVELRRLDPGREYHYRFHVDGWTSPSGRHADHAAAGRRRAVR